MTAAAAPHEIEIAMPGRFVDAGGTAVSFGDVELDQIMAGFDPARTPVPVVFGHPALDAPAHGLVSSVRRVGDKIKATLTNLSAEAVEGVKSRRFLRISPSLFTPTASNSPTPGKWALKHIGFLGAAAPAMQGLAPLNFAADPADAGAVTFDLPTPETFMSDPKTETPANTADFAAELARRDAEKQQLVTDIAAERQALVAERATLVAERATLRHADNVAFAEGLVAAGKLAPANKELVVGLQDQLVSTDTVAFGEAGELTPITAFRKLFDAAKPVVSFGEFAKGGAIASASDPVAIGKAAALLVEKGDFRSPADAVNHLMHRDA